MNLHEPFRTQGSTGWILAMFEITVCKNTLAATANESRIVQPSLDLSALKGVPAFANIQRFLLDDCVIG